ncbi:hypothetical protein [Vibrio agarivorans]|uniref:hypothetical protein n=1 Tax=Vibrio agarivorans TaxID=153622 RepID=UPI00222FE69B|nr:hypothetical protein [Vibrio agarivorans]MDN3660765.1 hypothetical protein [Vibrio agarivorans]
MNVRAKGFWFDFPPYEEVSLLRRSYRYTRAMAHSVIDKIKQYRFGPFDECHFHIGIHKTATTFVQDQIALSHMDRYGVKYYPLDVLRDKIYRFGFCSVGRRTSPHNRLLLSDENVLNGTEHLNKGVYFDCEQRVSWCIRHIHTKKLVVFINIRNFADFYTSAYCEHLRHFPYQSLEQYLAGLDITSLSWVDVFDSLFQSHPDVEFRVFNFDRFRLDKERLLASLTFGEVVEFSNQVKPSRSSFSEKEVALLSGDKDWIADSGSDKYAPFNTEIIEQTKRNLSDDLSRLKMYPNVVLLND